MSFARSGFAVARAHPRVNLRIGALLVALGVAGWPQAAEARLNGIGAQSCSGCHNGGPALGVTVTAGTQAVAAEQTLRLQVSLTGAAGAGLYLWLDEGAGTFINVPGESTRLEGQTGVVHTAPKRAGSGTTTFLVDFRPAAGTSGVLFGVAAVGANLDGRRQGDTSVERWLTVAVGCAQGQRYYRDFDGDGVGRSDENLQILACSPPMGFAPTGDDCDDNDARRAPGLPEVCNGIDDDCNGVVDDGLPQVLLYPDTDGDGCGGPGMSQLGCGPTRGWGVGDQDCDDGNPNVHPGAVEICNYVDDNCNGRTDEDARTVCGVGWCRRYALGCGEFVACEPGRPRKETCNYLDDDCDGEIDEESDVCPAGQRCEEGRCLFESDPAARPEVPTLDDDDDGAGASPGQGRTRGAHAGCSIVGAPSRPGAQRAGFVSLLSVLLVGLRRGLARTTRARLRARRPCR